MAASDMRLITTLRKQSKSSSVSLKEGKGRGTYVGSQTLPRPTLTFPFKNRYYMDEQFETQLQVALWSPDPPDFRDRTLSADEAMPLMEYIDHCSTKQQSADLRELMPPLLEPIEGVGVAAHACCTLMEYFRQLCHGDTTRLSRRFVHNVSRILSLKSGEGESSMRSVLNCLRKFGAPPSSLVRHLESLGKHPEDSPICYQYGKEYSEMQYFRLEESNPKDMVNQIKSLLNAGVPTVFGMAIPSSFGVDPRIDLRVQYDSIVGYTAGVIVGFDNEYRMSSAGAFSFQSCLSKNWGEGGYGWLSYDLFRHGMITDAWCAIQPAWLSQMGEDRGFRFEDTVQETRTTRNAKTHRRAPIKFPDPNRLH